jgi:hypothetical protein
MEDYWKFFACVGVMCLVYPPFLGFVIGMGSFLLLSFVIYKILQSL